MMNSKSLSRRRFLGATGATIIGSLIGLEGCSSGGGSSTTVLTGQDTILKSVLRPSQETTPPASGASGIGTAVIKSDLSSIQVGINLTGIVGVTMAHIHVGSPGSNGPVIFKLFDAGATPQNLSNINVTLNDSDFTAQPSAGVNNYANALLAISAGHCYFNVHTTANAGGEIRGQIGAVNLYCAINGLNVVPTPVAIPAQASALFVISRQQDSIGVSFDSLDLTITTSITVRVGDPLTNGPAIFTIVHAGQNLTASDLRPQAGAGISSFADAINAVLSGRTYVELQTTAIPTGELRGQIVPRGYIANLLGTEESPSVTTTATGSVLLTLSRDSTNITMNVQSTNLNGVTGIQLRAGARRTTGPALFTLYNSATDGAYNKSLVKTFQSTDLVPGGGIATFADFVTALNNGNIYIEAQTSAHANGEVRGQLNRQQ